MSPTTASTPDPDDIDGVEGEAADPVTTTPPSPGDRWSAFARGLVHAGLLAATAATVVREFEEPASVESVPPFFVALVVLLLIGACFTGTPQREVRSLRLRNALLAVVATAGTVLFIPLEAFAWTLTFTQEPIHTPSIAPSMLWIGVAAVATGAWIGALRDRPGPVPIGGRGVGAVVLGVVVLGVVVLSFHRPVVHRWDEDPGIAAPVPAQAQEVVWEWDADGSTVRVVHSGTHGPIVDVSDGLVALAGSDGRESWTYRLPGQVIDHTGTLSGGRWAYMVQSTPEDEARVWIMDAGTGELAIEDELFPADGWYQFGATERISFSPESPDDLLVASATPSDSALGGGSTSIAVADARTGDDLWSKVSEENDEALCHFGENPVLRDEVLLVARLCADASFFDEEDSHGRGVPVQVGYAVLDPLTSEVLHERLWEYEDNDRPWSMWSFGISRVETDGDGLLLALQGGGGSALVVDVATDEGRFVPPHSRETGGGSVTGLTREATTRAVRTEERDEGRNVIEILFARAGEGGDPEVTTTTRAPDVGTPDDDVRDWSAVVGDTGLVMWDARGFGDEDQNWELHAVSLLEPPQETTTVLTGRGSVADPVVAPGAVVLALSDRVIGIG
ncbi:hypothetical protein [Nocardiopsis sp. MG754419]|uniref:hypothetical protein n=1 Tax=Nocardiopsis sp. MG754419 TaxID=2259865 RepID=UPI001BAD292C|nr:hypothetical protein [Nocardiopsis sp. MG754419]MBR8743327.1 hypothetical protein [Nocardiopsis sp. MG754419]